MSTRALKSVMMNAKMANYLLGVFGKTPETQKRLLERTDIKIQNLIKPGSQISAHAEMVFMGNLCKVEGADWVWRHAKLWQPQLMGAFGNAIMNAPNCGEAMNIMTRFGHIWKPSLFIEQFHERTDNGVQRVMALGMVSGDDYGTYGATAARDIVMITAYRMLNHVLSQNWKGSEARFTGQINVSSDIYKRIFHCPVKTEQFRNGFSIPAGLCEQESLVADKIAFKNAVMRLQQISGPRTVNNTLEHQVINYLAVVTNGRPNAAEVAQALGVSQRTLNRRLQDGGTSFRDLLEASLKYRAHKLLEANTLSRADISERLGYNDQASFSRTLKRWNQNA